MKILLIGGGTGGHIMPILAVVDKLRKLNDRKVEFLFVGPKSNFNRVIENEGINVKVINAGKLRRYISIENIFDLIKFPVGIIQSLYIIYNFKPNIVFSKGGYASVPPVVVAWIFRISIITHESDIVPGLANRIISKFASKIFVSFSDSEKYFAFDKVVYTGNLVREEILNGNKERAKNVFDLKDDIPTVLIFGGSQGAVKINEVVLKSLPDILEKVQIIHICGEKNYEEIKIKIKDIKLKRINRYKVYPFLTDNLKDAYALSEIVISRAGANSLSEIIAVEKPSIIIPLPTSANNHQYKNAEYFFEKGLLIMIKEENLNPDTLIKQLSKLLQQDGFGANMKSRIRKYNSKRTNSAELLAKEIINFK